jgi:hypothetical protein
MKYWHNLFNQFKGLFVLMRVSIDHLRSERYHVSENTSFKRIGSLL